MGIELKLHEGRDDPATFPLHGQDSLVGRALSCDIVLDDPTISSRHGVLRADAGGYTFTDLGSRNGSAREREGRLEVATPGIPLRLEPGDSLLLGRRDAPVRLRVARGGVRPFAAAPLMDRTALAMIPLADLGGTSSDGLLRLAAAVAGAEEARALAEAAIAWLQEVNPESVRAAVQLFGSGFQENAGAPLPTAIRARLRAQGEDAQVEDEAGDAVGPGVVAPLVLHGVCHGWMAAWTESATSALPVGLADAMSKAATLVALGASGIAGRRSGELERRRLEETCRALASGGAEPLGDHPRFREAVAMCRAVATSSVPVLLTGETGSGKEVLARLVHASGGRRAHPFIAVNCGAIPDSLLESELFGHSRGAFTGATGERRGVFEQADGGTLFLDEIGEMPLTMQAKLLRVLEDGEVKRLGSERSAQVNVRVVSATHRDLVPMVEAGTFRRDLFYRLNTVTVGVPPLRERGDDVIVLAHRFLADRCALEGGKRVTGFSSDAIWALVRHSWPGNIRELRNEVARAVALTREGRAVEAAVFSEPLQELAAGKHGGPAPGSLRAQVEQAERAAIETALQHADRNVATAAERLGLSRTGLYKLMARLGVGRD